MTDKTRFRPVSGTEEQIQNAAKNPGWVYFASDTGKIFFDLDSNTRVAMGGSGVSLLYGEAPTIEPDEYSQYTLLFEHLEEDITPKEGDLILNKDGIFYRIQDVNLEEETIICTLMSVSGSGSGGSGGGGASYAKKIGIKITSPETSTLINGQPIGIKFTATSGVDIDGSVMDDKLTVRWTLEAKSGSSYTLYDQGLLDVATGIESTFELGEKLRPDATSRLTMQAVGVNSGESTSKYIEVVASELVLTQSANFSALNRYSPDNVQLQCNAIGSMNKILKYYFDNQLIQTVKLAASAENFQSYLVPSKYATHGSHTIRIELWQAIVTSGNWKDGIMVDPIEFEIGVFEANNETPVIWLGEYQEEYYNYDPIKIPFLVYDPANTASARITLKKNGTEIASSPRDIDTSKLDKWNYFEITDADLDMVNRYSIGCGDIERSISFMVSKDPNRKMEAVKQDYLKLTFDSRGRSNNESVVNRQLWQTADGKVKANFTDFNWYNNGWVLDEDNNTCLRISNGAQFSIPIGPMTFASTDSSKQSNSIEIQFKVRNVQDYSNLIHNVTRYVNDDRFYAAFKAQTQYNNYDAFLQYYLPIYELGADEDRVTYDSLKFDKVQKEISLSRVICGYYSGDESGAIGFALGPQDAFFSNGTNTVNVNYVENKMVNISMVYAHSSKLMYIYINGVLTGVIKSTANGLFRIGGENEVDKAIVFNSNFCDIDLYKMRIYNTDLNVNDIVTNYAVDYRDITIYDQNKLAEENTAINEYQFKYKNMIDYNEKHPEAPLMPYIIFDTEPTNNGHKLSYSKSTKLNIGVEFVNTGLDRAFQTGELEELAKADGLWNDDSSDEEKAEAVKKYYLHHCPSWKTNAGAQMAVQGTSSEFYPRRNYKIKTKTDYKTDTNLEGVKQTNIFLNRGPFEEDFAKHGCKASTKEVKDEEGNVVTPKYSNPCHTKNWYLDNYTNGTDVWTMKVDFMESSGSYNTGFANLVANAYSKHPLQDYYDKKAFTNLDLLKSDVTGRLDWSDYRTSVQGFPVLAFHKRGKDDYLFIGMYRMNLDKGSDACYGFDLPEEMTANFIEGNPPVAEIAECWEFCNNNRGFCSFRDPWDRMELSFKAPEGVANEFNSYKAPWIMDNVEYRYNVHEDAWDLLLKMSEAKPDDIEDIVKDYGEEYFFDPAANNYTGGRELAYKLYENWEKVNKWVWSTNTDKVPSQGTYQLVNVGNVDYVPGSFYIFNEETGEYEKADSDYVFNQIYYTRTENGSHEEDGVTVIDYVYSNAFAVGPELKYEANKFYREENDAYSIIEDSEFDSSLDYYMLVENDDYKTKADLIVRKCEDANYTEGKTYYTYDGTQTEAGKCVEPAKDASSATYAPGKYYEAIEVKYGNKTYTHDTKEYRAAKFVNELKDWFDLEYLATYFIMTEVFECYDSRGKNAMWASWGPLEAGKNYKWYPIFYDIDTQLGINNTGIPSFDYNVDATEAGNYSTSDSVLWNNFYKYFKNSYILMKYKHLKGVTEGVTWTSLDHAPLYSVDRIEGWYRTDPKVTGSIAMRGERPLIAVNLDEYFKYITITNKASYADGTTGHIASNDSGDYAYDANGTYFYALQGDRSLSRQQFLTNRIEYIDSWLNQGNYKRGGANRIRGRVAANNAEKTSDIWVETAENPYYQADGKTKTNLFDAEYWLNLTPIRSSYVTVSDDAEAYPSRKYDGVNPVKFNIDAIEAGVRKSGNYPEQLLYVYGLNQMTDLGDMSKLYWQEFEISGDASKLTTLKIGYDGLMETKETKEELVAQGYPENKIIEKDGKCYIGWYNNKVNQPSIPASKDASGMPLLKEVNFCNVTINTGSPALDLSSCEKLQNFRATGSNFIDLTFAEGAAMHTCYLPSTITKLDLVECNLLTKLITEYEYPVADEHGNLEAEKGLYIQGMFEDDGTTVINYFSILGGGLGYDSYKLLKKYFDIRKRQTAQISNIALTKVNWSPYVQLVEGDVYDSSKKYFYDDGHYGFKEYTYNAATFPIQVLNGELYRLDETIPAATVNQISDVEMFKTFIEDGLYVGTAENSTCPNITGIMYVANETAVDELWIRNTLVKKFPQLTVFFKTVTPAYSARFILQEANGTWDYVPNIDSNNLEPSVQKIASGWFSNPYKLYAPVKDNYDFHGWSTTNDLEGLISSADADEEEQNEAWSKLALTESKDYTFYAIFTVHKWEITYSAGADENSMTKWHSEKITHGELLKTPKIVPSIDESNLATEERYRFLGWTQNVKQLIVTNENEAKLVNIGSILATQDTQFYGVFLKESVYDSATDASYFDFVDYDFEDPITGAITSGLRLSPNTALSGKVTLPVTYNNKPVVSIAGFGTTQVTHVFWDGTSQCKEVASMAFQNINNLKYFDLAKSIVTIRESAFAQCPNLLPPDFANSSLTFIGTYAYSNSLYHPTTFTLNLPACLQRIEDGSFAYCSSIGNGSEPAFIVNFGAKSKPTQIAYLGSQPFAQTNTRKVQYVNVYGDISDTVKAYFEAQVLPTLLTDNSGAVIGTISYVSA